jgi:Na+-transporting methylmalonyl-CoA/oxaloacetate decarboxylase gamma subunit
MLLLLAGVLLAQPAQAEPEVDLEELEELNLEAIQAATPDTLWDKREQEVIEEYGFSNRNKLIEVAVLLEIDNVAKWKRYLKLEPENEALDEMSLSKLGITPYQALLARQYSIYGFTEHSTFAEISERECLPIKIMREKLGLNSQDKSYDNYSLQAMGIRPAAVDSLITEFNDNSVPYGFSLTLVGMTITFAALFITSFVVSRLQIVNRKPKDEVEEAPAETDPKIQPVAKKKIQDRNEVAAAIMALHMYETGIKERRKMMLTFKRTPTNQWRASQVLEMPNRELSRLRR